MSTFEKNESQGTTPPEKKPAKTALEIQEEIRQFNSQRQVNPEFLKEIKELFSKPIIVVNTRPIVPQKPESSESTSSNHLQKPNV